MWMNTRVRGVRERVRTYDEVEDFSAGDLNDDGWDGGCDWGTGWVGVGGRAWGDDVGC